MAHKDIANVFTSNYEGGPWVCGSWINIFLLPLPTWKVTGNVCSCIHDPLKMWLVEVALVCCIVCNNHCSLHITKLLHPPIAHKTFDRNPNYFPCIGKSKHFQLSSNRLVFVFPLFLYSGPTPWYVLARLAGDQLSSVVTQPTTFFGYCDLPIATHLPTKKSVFWDILDILDIFN